MIGDDVTGTLPELRAYAESLMVTACSLDHPAPVETWPIDPDTGHRTPTWVAYWTGRCELKSKRESRTVMVGQQTVTVQQVSIGIPWNAPRPEVGDRVTTSEGTFYVNGVDHHSHKIKRRFTADEHQG